jgi:electron transfer flavoprotein beta subunit
VQLKLPAVISVGDAINEPRYPSLKAIMGARKKPLEKVGAGDVGIDASLVGAEGSRVECGDFHAPEAKPSGKVIEDEDTNDTVEQIVAWLEERKLI